MSDVELITQLEPKSDSELLAVLGAQLLGEGLGVGVDDDDEHRRFGQRWFEDHVEAIKRAVCGTRIIRELSGDFTADATALAAVILPATTNSHLLSITVAAIVIRRGVGAFCADFE